MNTIIGIIDGLRRRALDPFDERECERTRAYMRAYTVALTIAHPRTAVDPCMRAQGLTRRQERAEERGWAEVEREHDEEVRTGRRLCPTCGERSVIVSSRPTRQYGGGFDTSERCENESCDYAEVYV